jgi:hypothetical protein
MIDPSRDIEGAASRSALILEALAYRRNTGASLEEVRAYAQGRQDRPSRSQEDRAILAELTRDGTLYSVGRRWFLTPHAHRAAKGHALKPEWEGSDAWILLAVLFCGEGRGVGLQEIVGAADYINHDIPSLEEVHGALNRLASGGLVRSVRGGYKATARGLELFERVRGSCGRGALDQLEGLEWTLRCPSCGVRLKAVRWCIRLEAASYDESVKAYQSRTRGRKPPA